MLKDILKRISAIAIAGTMLAGMITVPASATTGGTTDPFTTYTFDEDFDGVQHFSNGTSTYKTITGTKMSYKGSNWGNSPTVDPVERGDGYAAKFFFSNEAPYLQYEPAAPIPVEEGNEIHISFDLYTGTTYITGTLKRNILAYINNTNAKVSSTTDASSTTGKLFQINNKGEIAANGVENDSCPVFPSEDWADVKCVIKTKDPDYDNRQTLTVTIDGTENITVPSNCNIPNSTASSVSWTSYLDADGTGGTNDRYTAFTGIYFRANYNTCKDMRLDNLLVEIKKPVTSPTDLTAVENYESGAPAVELNWSPASAMDTTATVTYNVWRTDANGANAVNLASNVSECTHTDSTVAYGSSYKYYVVATDGKNLSEKSTIVPVTVEIGKPKNLTPTLNFSTSGSSLRLDWGTPDDLVGVTGVTYTIFRNDEELESVTDLLTYTDDTVVNDEEYTYYVVANILDTYTSVASDSKGVTIAYVGRPSEVEAVQAVNDNVVDLSWGTVTNADTYQIYRNGVLYRTVDAPATEYEDTDIDYGNVYQYYIVAVGQPEGGEPLSSRPSDVKTVVAIDPIYDGVFVPISGTAKDLSTNADATVDPENKMDGESSYEVSFGAANTTGISVANTVDFFDGGLITLCVDADDVSLDGINLKLASSTEAAEVELSRYAPSTINGWTYIAVPIADLIALNGAVDFENIDTISVYAATTIDPSITLNIDKIAYTNYKKPVAKLYLEDGVTEVTGAIESSGTVNKLVVGFTSDVASVTKINDTTVKAETVKVTLDGAPQDAYANVTDKGIEIYMPDGLKADKTTYKVVIDGVKTYTGAAINTELGFETGSVGTVTRTSNTILNNLDLLDILYLDYGYSEMKFAPTGFSVTTLGRSGSSRKDHGRDVIYPNSKNSSGGTRTAEDDVFCLDVNSGTGLTSINGVDYVIYGTQHLNTTTWTVPPYDVSEYADTAVVSIDVNIPSALKDNAHVFLKDSNGYTIVDISDMYLTAGVWQKLTIPLKRFVNAGFNAAGLLGGGLAFTDTTNIEGTATVKYDNMWIANVAAPREVELVGTSGNSATISWKSSKGKVEKYKIMRDGVEIAEVSSTTTQYTDNTLPGAGTYEYFVYGANELDATSIPSNRISVTIGDVGAPLNLNVKTSFATELKAELTWQAPESLGTYTYDVYRASEDGAFTAIETGLSAPSHIDTGIENNTEYTYYVVAIKDGISSEPSVKCTVTVGYMGVPENLTATDTPSGIALAWNAVENAQKYNIYRNGAFLDEVSAPGTTYVDPTGSLVVGDTYAYTVKAVYGSEESVESKTVYAVHYGDVIDGGVETVIYSDFTEGGRVATTTGGASIALDNEVVAMGDYAYKINFKSGNEKSGIEIANDVDMSNHYNYGGLITMYVNAENAKALEGVKLGLSATLDTTPSNTTDSKFAKGTVSVPLSDYVTRGYGDWVFVQIPMSDFPTMADYNATDVADGGKIRFDYSLVEDISIYVDKNTELEKVLYIDQLTFTKYVAPAIAEVRVGTVARTPGAVINPDGTTELSGTAVEKLTVTFDKAMVADSFTSDTVKLKEGVREVATDAVYDSVNGILNITIPGGLKQGKNYKLVFDGVKSQTGGVADPDDATSTINFSTAADLPEVADVALPTTSPAPNFTLTVPTSLMKDAMADVKVTLDGEAAKANIASGEITVKYNQSILSVLEGNIKLSSALRIAGATVALSAGKITVTIPDGSDVILGSDIMTISFNAYGSGNPFVEATATLTDTVTPTANTVTFVKTSKTFNVSAVNSATNILPPSNDRDDSSSSLPFGPTRDTTTNTDDVFITDQNGNNQPASDAIFADTANHWAKDYIEFLYKNGYVSGYDDGTYGPDNSITREEFVKMLLGAAKVDTTGATTTFGDISESDWCYAIVAAAERDGVVNGDDAGNFGKGRRITREDMCTMVVRAADIYYINFKATYLANMFDDYAEISDYAKDSVMRLQTAGVIDGVGDNKFAPKGEVTRAMAAKIIYEVVQKIANG